MGHIRLRKYNTKDAFPEQKLDNDLCWIVRAGRRIYIRGQTGRIWGTDQMIGAEDIAAQADNAMQNMDVLLKEAGARWADVCGVRLYVSDRAYVVPVTNAVGRWLKGVYPTMSVLIIKGFARPQYGMEVDLDVVLSDGD
jgi:enamine deaminase RidA (YjgF/YER057c/UK114 family)